MQALQARFKLVARNFDGMFYLERQTAADTNRAQCPTIDGIQQKTPDEASCLQHHPTRPLQLTRILAGSRLRAPSAGLERPDSAVQRQPCRRPRGYVAQSGQKPSAISSSLLSTIQLPRTS